jgi:hypothetical protein
LEKENEVEMAKPRDAVIYECALDDPKNRIDTYQSNFNSQREDRQRHLARMPIESNLKFEVQQQPCTLAG